MVATLYVTCMSCMYVCMYECMYMCTVKVDRYHHMKLQTCTTYMYHMHTTHVCTVPRTTSKENYLRQKEHYAYIL